MSSLRRWVEAIDRRLPAPLGQWIDRHNPGVWQGRWSGGAFGGQKLRRQCLTHLLCNHPPAFAIETGTHTGVTTHFLAQILTCPVISIESQERYFQFARHRLSQFSHVRLYKGTSPTVLERLLPDLKREFATAQTDWGFFYLDAHWHDRLPLRDEIGVIVGSEVPALVVIDDFRVPHDPEFGYDTYADSGPLDSRLIADLIPTDWSIWFPTYLAKDESGTRRGWILCASPEMGFATRDLRFMAEFTAT